MGWIRLRHATGADHDALYAIHRAALGPYVVQTFGPWDDAFQRERFADTMTKGHVEVVEVDGEVAGRLQTRDSGDSVQLINIELAPRFQGRGIGTGLVVNVIAAAGDRPVTLQVLKVNPARSLYERLGFVLTGETETHFQMRHEPEQPLPSP